MTKQRDIIEFANAVRQHGNPNTPPETVTALVRLAKRHEQYAVDQCNGAGVYANWDGETDPKAVKTLETRIAKLAAEAGASVRFSGDPRGATVKLVFADGATNDWGQTGWCIPT